MKTCDLIPHITTGESDNSFVGIRIIGNEVHFYYPESYHFDPDSYDKDDVLDLLKTISIAKSKSQMDTTANNAREYETELALLSYVWIIEDYLKNGYYSSVKKVIKENERGKINWKKTFHQMPIISGSNVVYNDIFVETKSPQESVLVEAYRYCVKKSITMLGWLYGISKESIETAPDSELKETEYIFAIREELSRTFDDEKRSRLTHMENVILGLDEIDVDNNIVYGVDTYHYVFERMIDRIFGTENAADYYPTFRWNLKYSKSDTGLSGPTIRPDTIMKDGQSQDIYIIDSKFYRYGANDLSQTKGLPEAASIVKQIMYGSYVSSMSGAENVYNVFMLPYNSKGHSVLEVAPEKYGEQLLYVGNVESDWEADKTYGRIYTFLIDLKYVIKTYNRIAHENDRMNLVKAIREETSVLADVL